MRLLRDHPAARRQPVWLWPCLALASLGMIVALLGWVQGGERPLQTIEVPVTVPAETGAR